MDPKSEMCVSEPTTGRRSYRVSAATGHRAFLQSAETTDYLHDDLRYHSSRRCYTPFRQLPETHFPPGSFWDPTEGHHLQIQGAYRERKSTIIGAWPPVCVRRPAAVSVGGVAVFCASHPPVPRPYLLLERSAACAEFNCTQLMNPNKSKYQL